MLKNTYYIATYISVLPRYLPFTRHFRVYRGWKS